MFIGLRFVTSLCYIPDVWNDMRERAPGRGGGEHVFVQRGADAAGRPDPDDAVPSQTDPSPVQPAPAPRLRRRRGDHSGQWLNCLVSLILEWV